MDEHLNLVPLNLQFFANPVPVDMRLVADITDLTKPPKYLFTTMSAADEEEQGENEDETGSEIIAEEYEPDDPLLFPRLAVTDQNLPHTAVGEAVVRSAEGELYTVSVEKDGTVTDSSFQIGADNIEEGSITGSKLEESTITTRELDMAEIFADATALNQTLVENLDTSSLFNNDNFLTRLDERVNEQMADKAVLKEGGTMTGPLVLNGKPEQEFGAATKQYVDTMIGKLEAAVTTKAEARLLTATLPAAEWSGSPPTQTVDIVDILETDAPVCGAVVSGDADHRKAQKMAWSMVEDIRTIDGGIVALCYESAPTIDIQIQLQIVRGGA